MSRKKKKTIAASLTLKMSSDEKMMLDAIANKSRRDLAEMVFWLIEGYYKGELDDVQKIVMSVDRAIRAATKSAGLPGLWDVVPKDTGKAAGRSQEKPRIRNED